MYVHQLFTSSFLLDSTSTTRSKCPHHRIKQTHTHILAILNPSNSCPHPVPIRPIADRCHCRPRRHSAGRRRPMHRRRRRRRCPLSAGCGAARAPCTGRTLRRSDSRRPRPHRSRAVRCRRPTPPRRSSRRSRSAAVPRPRPPRHRWTARRLRAHNINRTLSKSTLGGRRWLQRPRKHTHFHRCEGAAHVLLVDAVAVAVAVVFLGVRIVVAPVALVVRVLRVVAGVRLAVVTGTAVRQRFDATRVQVSGAMVSVVRTIVDYRIGRWNDSYGRVHINAGPSE